jgi:membrane-bound serine protease (ClpP class)
MSRIGLVLIAAILLLGQAPPQADQSDSPARANDQSPADTPDEPTATARNARGADSPDADAAEPTAGASDPLPAPATQILKTLRQGAVVGIIPIEGLISDVTHESMERRVEQARNAGAQIIVFRMDTYGGLVTSALAISTTIKNYSFPTVAWVNTKAISAGALISLACDEIVMAPRSTIGDCAPISVSPQGGAQPMGQTEREKIETVIREEFRDSARRNGYPQALCEAMVTLGPAVYQIRNKQTGQVKYVPEPDLSSYGLRSPRSDPDADQASILEWFRQASADSQWEIVQRARQTDQLLTLSQDEAVDFGFCEAIIADQAELADWLKTDPANLKLYETTWSEELAGWLTSPAVRGVLFLVFMLGLYMEFQSPGIGVAGAGAAIALALMLIGPYLTGMADWLEPLLILIGLALLAVEIFVIPGVGLAGFAGILFILSGMVLSFVPSEPGPGFIPQLPGTWAALETGLLTTLIAMIVGIIGIIIMIKFFGMVPGFNRMILADAQPAMAATPESGTTGPHAVASGRSGTSDQPIRPGDTGKAQAELHPVGPAVINGQLVDVVSAGQWIAADAPVRVVEVAGNRIVVENA